MGAVSERSERRDLRFGVNYVPSRGWFYSWLDFSADDVRRDLGDLAGLGIDHVRVFPIWPWIQPNRGHLREQAIADLLCTIDIAADFGLEVAVDLVQGHLSSFDFLPTWAVTWHQGSVFEDRGVRDGLAAYVDTLSRAVADRSNVFAITLGNEVNNLFPSNGVTARSAHTWAVELLDVVRGAAPDLIAVHSLHDEAFYIPGHPFAPTDSTDLGDLTSVHSWVFTGAGALDAPAGPATLTNADYLIELAGAMALEPDRPVWLQEIGAPRPDIPAEDAAAFTAGTLARVLDNPLLWGVTWWCSHDIDRRLVDFPEREYDLGLFTVDHELKPAGQALAQVIETARNPAAPAPAWPRPALAAPDDLRGKGFNRSDYAPGSSFHDLWVQLRHHSSIAIVSADRARDLDYLQARGISSVLDVPTLARNARLARPS